MMKSAHPSLHVHGRKTLKKDCVAVNDLRWEGQLICSQR
jgi:hypothetical protein